MIRNLLPPILAGLMLSTIVGNAETGIVLKSIKVDLPTGDRLFEGPGSDLANNDCLACHSAGMVLNQPALSKLQWQAEVEKMRMTYKAPIDAEDVGAIVDYLVSIRGAE